MDIEKIRKPAAVLYVFTRIKPHSFDKVRLVSK